jgi:hypothetical protein
MLKKRSGLDHYAIRCTRTYHSFGHLSFDRWHRASGHVHPRTRSAVPDGVISPAVDVRGVWGDPAASPASLIISPVEGIRARSGRVTDRGGGTRDCEAAAAWRIPSGLRRQLTGTTFSVSAAKAPNAARPPATPDSFLEITSDVEPTHKTGQLGASSRRDETAPNEHANSFTARPQYLGYSSNERETILSTVSWPGAILAEFKPTNWSVWKNVAVANDAQDCSPNTPRRSK